MCVTHFHYHYAWATPSGKVVAQYFITDDEIHRLNYEHDRMHVFVNVHTVSALIVRRPH